MRILPCFVLIACAGAGGLPAMAVEHNARGVAEIAADRLDDAEARFRLALEYHPRFAEPHANLGLVMLRRGDLSAAEDFFRTAILIDGDFDEAWSNLGVVLAQQGHLEEAAAAFERALSIDPGLVDARRNLADTWIRLARFGPARAQLMRLVQLTPGGRAAGQLAYCDLRLGRPAAARARAQEVLTANPQEPHARLVRGIIHASAGRDASALEDLLVAERDEIVIFDARLRIVAIQVNRGRAADATPRIQWLLQQAPRNSAVRLVAAWHALTLGHPDTALAFGRGALHADSGLEAAQVVIQRACAAGAACEFDPGS